MESAEQLSLSWDAHQKSICSGLSLLQQRGEFVDMTLAADGHHVKVHQMVLSLVSPYIKDLISTAQCPHPVIFLNNISYTTLCALLEYVYSGEVLVDKNKLPDLITAGKALHIRGLRDLDDEQPTVPAPAVSISAPPIKKSIIERLKEIKENKRSAGKQENKTPACSTPPICKVFVDETNEANEDSTMNLGEESMDFVDMDSVHSIVPKNTSHSDFDSLKQANSDFDSLKRASSDFDSLKRASSDFDSLKRASSNSPNIGTLSDSILSNQKLEYSLSNQGGLQVIHNRYIYNLRYCGKKDLKKLWRCIDYTTSLRCSASIFTNANNQVIQRSFTHNHPFHDSKILKKVRLGTIYSVFKEAEDLADDKKKERSENRID